MVKHKPRADAPRKSTRRGFKVGLKSNRQPDSRSRPFRMLLFIHAMIVWHCRLGVLIYAGHTGDAA